MKKITGDLVINQMKDIAEFAARKSKDSVCIELRVWCHKHGDKFDSEANTSIWYGCNSRSKQFTNLKDLGYHVYKGRRRDDS